MICSTSSSSSARGGGGPGAAVAAALVLAALVARAPAAGAAEGPATAPPALPAAPSRLADLPPEVPGGGRGARIALLPVENLTGRPADGAPLLAALESALATAGVAVVSGEPVEAFLARHRIRATGGLGRQASAAARTELGVEAVLVTSLLELDREDPPRLSILSRLVSADADPTLYWMDGAARTGADRPGLLQLGLIHDHEVLQRAVVDRLVSSLVAFLDGGPVGEVGCPGGSRFRPRLAYRNLVPSEGLVATVAVLPFRNQAPLASAGEVVALEVVRQLGAAGRFRIMEPAVVRAELLNRRILIPDGMSAETARMLLGALEVDYLVSGTVLRYADVRGPGAEPDVEFTTTMLESRTARFAWHSSSAARGSDGVFLFDVGRVRSSADLTCRLVREVASGILGGGDWPRRAPTTPARSGKAGATPALPAPPPPPAPP